MKKPITGSRILRTWLSRRESERSSNPVGVYTEKNVSNFFRMNDVVTINALDDIIESSRLVYGPHGGLYGESIGSLEFNDVSDDMVFMKSKDGHNYLLAQRYDHTVDDAILTMIKQYTKFIAEFRNKKSSKDGTTSLALLSANLAKFVLMARDNNKDDKDKFMQVPLSVETYIMNLLTEVGSSLVDKYRYETYNPTTKEYNENGYDYNLSAIKTTVDNNPILVNEFKKLMDKNKELKIDITSAFIGQIAFRTGEPDLQIEVKNGIKMRVEPVGNAFTSYEEMTSPLFILEGGIRADHKYIFKKMFVDWLTKLANQINQATGKSFFDFKHEVATLGQPVFLCTVVNDTLKQIITEIHHEGIRIMSTEGQIEQNFLRPIFMRLFTDEIFEDRYQDIKTIMPDNVVSLTDIDRYITTEIINKGKRYYDEKTGVANKEPFPYNTVAMDLDLFPNIDLPTLSFHKFLTLEYTKPWNAFDGENNVLNGVNVIIKENPVIDAKSALKFLCISAYDGNSLYVAPSDDEQVKAMIELRNAFSTELNNSRSSLAHDDGFLKRVDALSTVSIYPTIYGRTNDERTLMQTLYEDAIGVFASVHTYGVMPGGNVGFIKFFKEFETEAFNRFKTEFIEKLELKPGHKYIKFFNTIVASIKMAYSELFINLFPSREEGNQRYRELKSFAKNNPDKFMYAFDIVREEFNDKVFEAAQTTVDNFYAAMSFTKDLLDLKTIKYKPGHNATYPMYRIVDGGPFHIRNKELKPKENHLNSLEK